MTDQNSEFNGLIVDTGANLMSLMSLQLYRAYCREHGVPAQIFKDRSRITGLGSSHYSVGTAVVSIPFPSLGLVCDVTFHILEENFHTPLSRRDLKQTGIDLSMLKDCIYFMGKAEKLVVENDFLYYRWASDAALITYGELLKLHRSFGHPSVSSLYKILKSARPSEAGPEVQKAINHLSARCKVCTELGQNPKRFKLTPGA